MRTRVGLPSSSEADEFEPNQAGLSNDPVAPEEEEFIDLPPPEATPRVEQQPEGKVFGRSRGIEEKPSHLTPYENTIVIGGDPRKEPPPPPPQPAYSGPPAEDLEQTMVAGGAPQPPMPPQAPPPPAIDKEIIAQAEAQAEQMIQNAQMQANQILQEAMGQAEQMRAEAHQQGGQQGYQEGLQAGLEEGRQHGQAELLQRIEQAKIQFVQLVRLRRKILLDMEPEIVRLAWEVAKRVVGEELQTNREVIVGVVRSSLETLRERDEILIRVHPSEFENVKGHQTEFEAMIEGLKKFTVQSDGAIEPGSCAIETNLGNVDARIDTQFEAIRLGLEEMSKIRQFERQDALNSTPVEVPGDPDFEARVMQVEQAEEPGHGHGHGHGHGGGGHGHPQVAPEEPSQGYEEAQEIEFLPEPTEEIFATLTPEQQQQYLEIYHEQQEYLARLQAEMEAEE